jgi:anti-anti-sigma factor
MNISVRAEGEVTVVSPAGEISTGGGGLARPLGLRGDPLIDLSETLRTILNDGVRWILLDLDQVRFLDSAGLGELVACYKRAIQKGGDIRLMRPSAKVRELLEMTGLVRVFRVFTDETEALDSFRA